MTSRTRLLVLAVSTPVIAFAIIGGYLGQAMTRDELYKHLRVFEDVVSLVMDHYVEEVDVEKAMRGAMNGLSANLDSDSAFLPADIVKAYESNASPGPADIGVVLGRQYYLRIVAVGAGTPAARAGLRTGDLIRAINTRSTKDLSVYEGERLLRGAVGSKVALLVIRTNAAEPHEVDLVRERPSSDELSSRMADRTIGYVRVNEFTARSSARLKQSLDTLASSGASRYIIDLRGTARGDIDTGAAAARLFVKSGTLTTKEAKDGRKEVIAAAAGDGAIASRVVLLVDQGTSGAAEVFASALDGNGRAELVGQHTFGRAARQRLVKLPDGSGFLLSYLRYLAPDGTSIHEKGLTPDVAVEQPEVEFGAPPPTADAGLERALELLAAPAA